MLSAQRSRGFAAHGAVKGVSIIGTIHFPPLASRLFSCNQVVALGDRMFAAHGVRG